ncbi:E2 domain-containing protein [Sulfitobacter sp. CS16]|uniref:E2 domain-containing protein n=1 Tax=Sulfitobacter sp. CS16 TaxID=3368573 RepID=UPI003746B582
MNTLHRLLQNVPEWASIKDRKTRQVTVLASPPGTKTMSADGFWLRLKLSGHGGVAVREVEDKRQLPAFCLERHINPDSTFCVYFRSEYSLENDEAAKTWWSYLSVYLRNQVYAHKRGVWPLGSGLSHGDAAHTQITMEALAEPLGWKDDLWLAMFRGQGWLAESLPRISRDCRRVLNARTPCPRGCRWKHKLLRKKSCILDECNSNCNRLHKPILRAECPNRDVIEKLVLRENERQRIESEIINSLKKDGKKCCGSMKRCPLAT